MKTFRNAIFLKALTIFLCGSLAMADDGIGSKPIPGSAHEMQSAMDGSMNEEQAPETTFEELLNSSKLSLKLRNYYFNRNKPAAVDPFAWAQGGILDYKMGRVGGIFSLNVELMGSYPLYAPEEHDGTLLLESGQDPITIFGTVNPRFTFAGNVLSVYRQRYNLPYVNEQDNRMLPNTFEGYTVGLPIANSKQFQYILGYIDRIKKRDSDEFVSMTDAAGVTEKEHGIFAGGLRYYPIEPWSIAGINYYAEDVLNIFYGETVYKAKLSEDVEGTFQGQYSSQSSVGDDLLRGDSYTAEMFGLQGALSYNGWVGKLAVNSNSDGGLLQSPWGSYPGYNSVIVEDFNRAGEDSWQAGLSYDFSKIGVQGVSLAAAYVSGTNAIDDITEEDLADKKETDLTLDYRVKEGTLNGLWVRLRSAFIDEDGGGTTQDFRVIVNYEIPILN